MAKANSIDSLITLHCSDPPAPQVKLVGSWGTKLEAALRRVVRGAAAAPGDKWLVFSAFQDALAMLAKGLAANGVGSVHLRGNREARLVAASLHI